MFQDTAPEGLVNVFEAPPVEGLGTAGGFKIMIEDRGDLGLDTLQEASEAVVAAGEEQTTSCKGCSPASGPTRPGCSSTSTASRPRPLGVSMGEVCTTLQVFFGSLYINDFNRFGRTWQVNAQGMPEFRKADRGHQPDQDPQRQGADGAAGRRSPR